MRDKNEQTYRLPNGVTVKVLKNRKMYTDKENQHKYIIHNEIEITSSLKYRIFMRDKSDALYWTTKKIHKLIKKLSKMTQKNIDIAFSYYEIDNGNTGEIFQYLKSAKQGEIFDTECKTTEVLTQKLEQMNAFDKIKLKPNQQDKVDYVEENLKVYTNHNQPDKKYRWVEGIYIATDMGILGYIA